MLIMVIRNKINVIRLCIASFVIFGSLSDYFNSYTDETIQAIAMCDKMGYCGIDRFRTHMLTTFIIAVIYMLFVILHMIKYKGKRFGIFISIVDFVILIDYFYTLLTI